MPRTDWQELDWYVSLRRADAAGTRTALLAGPFATHTEALALVRAAADEAERCDPRAFWDAHGTCSLPRAAGNPLGKLNDRIGATVRPLPPPY